MVRMPAEWERQDWIWIGFPAAQNLWEEALLPAQQQIAEFANAIAATGQQVCLVVRDEATEFRARELLQGDVRFEKHPYGDIWLRDIGPLSVIGASNDRQARLFNFNGWGGKYFLKGDEETGASLADRAGLPYVRADWVLEGGALDTDGTGLVVTTEQCLLNPNRNPGLSREEIEARLHRDLGFHRVLWLGDGLRGDHTDGHVDNLARFFAPGRIAIPRASDDDPNAGVYEDAAVRSRAFGLEVVRVPSPGRTGAEGDIEPASYMNFVIANKVVVVPTYGSRHDSEAVEAIGALFPGRRTVGLRANAVLTGGGSFHCCSQQVPALS